MREISPNYDHKPGEEELRLPPLNKGLLKDQIDIAYERMIDKVNAFLKMKGLEKEFEEFLNPKPLSETILELRRHELR